ncbi:hypothetical protein [Pyxidicoccus sp. MSG2]|uniref:hypothetical protein n=1 Tax=Pyxidicoccus sp. MSG2 TaxID=2996790 RepID=UPI0022717CC3|nr:hypothetical protein [Pyxidicoccus sp. MSG2]MCY1019946.1 hypothetical protein [Pyxidicoccus sp. MSG2]
MLNNRSLRFAALLAASLGLAPSALAAETPQSNKPYIFETVDSYVVVNERRVEVTGILQGESAPRTFAFSANAISNPHLLFTRCDRMALLAMSKPGLYSFEMVQGADSYIAPTCRLTRR